MKRTVKFTLKNIKKMEVEGKNEVEILNNIKKIISSLNKNSNYDMISFYMEGVEDKE